MRPHYEQGAVTIYHGDCLDVLRELGDDSIDAVVTDPPYGLEFMGKEWDSFKPKDIGRGVKVAEQRADEMTPSGRGHATSAGPYLAARVDSIRSAGLPFQQWCEAWAAECLRVLKPGGHLLAFGGSRTWHRLAAGVEDAGFEIRDSIAWLYGSGFPKSLDVSKAIDAVEMTGKSNSAAWRHVNENRPGEAWVRENTNNRTGQWVGEKENTGPSVKRDTPATDAASQWEGWGTALKPAFEPIVVARKPLVGTVAGNVLAHGTGALNIDACRVAGEKVRTTRNTALGVMNDDGWKPTPGAYETPDAGRWPANVVLDESQAEELDRQSGTLTSGVLKTHHARAPKEAGILGAYGSAEGERGYGDSGGASRFFPTFRYEAKAPSSERPKAGEVQHPTVKPLDLMRWLVRLVTPPNGVILEPFAGSGTTVEAAVLEGFRCVAIEREADYLPLIEKRLSKPMQQSLFGDWDEDGAA